MEMNLIFEGYIDPDHQVRLANDGFTTHVVPNARAAKRLARTLSGGVGYVPLERMVNILRDDFEAAIPGLHISFDPCKLACELDPDDNQPKVTVPPNIQIAGLPTGNTTILQAGALAEIKKLNTNTVIGHLLMVRSAGNSADYWYWNNAAQAWPANFRVHLPTQPPDFTIKNTDSEFGHESFGNYLPPPSNVHSSYAIKRPSQSLFAFLKIKKAGSTETAYWWAKPSNLDNDLLRIKLNETWEFRFNRNAPPPTHWNALKATAP